MPLTIIVDKEYSKNIARLVVNGTEYVLKVSKLGKAVMNSANN